MMTVRRARINTMIPNALAPSDGTLPTQTPVTDWLFQYIYGICVGSSTTVKEFAESEQFAQSE